jgi:putative endonuclease
MSSKKTWFVYLIECVDGSLYTGITVDLAARFRAHCEGRGARYMRLHPPLRMLAAEAHPDRSAASKAEYRIKQLSPAGKRDYAIGMIPDPLATN